VGSRHPAQARRGVTLHLVPGTGQEGAAAGEAPGSRSFRRYPLWRVLGLNGLNVVHYVVGCVAILVAYRSYPLLGWPVGLAYFVFAVVHLYVLKPLVVCPGCVYRTVRDGRCPSGLNLVSARLCPPAPGATGFEERSRGALSQSSLCLVSFVLPVPLAVAGLAFSFSWTGLTLTATFALLTVIRSTVVEPRDCSHCLARRWCPAARTSARFGGGRPTRADDWLDVAPGGGRGL
jgi:hypothetical protein